MASQGRTSDLLYADIAAEVPSFGGMYVDEESNSLIIWLTDGEASLSAARVALLKILPGNGFERMTFRARQAEFTWLQLLGWRDRLGTTDLMSGQGVYGWGLGMGNRLSILVGLDVDRPALEAKLVDLDIPVEAVIIEEGSPIQLLSVRQKALS
jgi:hypothetical protein